MPLDSRTPVVLIMNETHPDITVALVIYCGMALIASLAGGWIPMFIRLTHTRLQIAVSLVAGLILGMGLLHMIPHAFWQTKSMDGTVWCALVGFLGMFFLQRFLHFHHHDLPDEDPEDCCRDECCQSHQASHSASDAIPHAHTLAEKSAHQLSWAGTAFGLGLHSLLDGVALGAAVAADAGHSGPLGLGAALAIILHKPFDAMAVATLMASGKMSKLSRHLWNGVLSLMTPVGVLLVYVGAHQFSGSPSAFLGYTLAFAGGMFLCIACSDLLPELQFHSHDRFKLSFALLVGVGIAASIGMLETSGHDSHQHGPAIEQQDHEHEAESHVAPAR